MGAYENPQTVVDDKSALILAKGFESFATSLNTAVLARAKKEKELADQALLDDATYTKATASGTRKADKAVNEYFEKFGDPGDAMVKMVRGNLARQYELEELNKVFIPRNEEQKAELEANIKEEQQLRALNDNFLDAIQDVDTSMAEVGEAQIQSGEGLLMGGPGTVDKSKNSGNDIYFKAASILNSQTTAEKAFEQTTNSQGDVILKFYPEGEEAFEWNVTQNPSPNKVPETTKKIDTALTGGENPVYVKTNTGYKISDKYLQYEENERGQKEVKKTYRYVTEEDGTVRREVADSYDVEGLRTATAAQVQASIQGMSDRDMQSQFTNQLLVDTAGEDITYVHEVIVNGEKVKKEKTVTITPEILNTKDGAPLSDEQKQIFLAAQTFVTNANFPVSLDYKVDSKGKAMTTAEKNIIDGLNRLESGQSKEISIGSKTFVRKKGNEYEVYTVGTQLGNEKTISTTADIDKIIDLISTVDKAKVRKRFEKLP
jgi:hypothetical protein